MKNYWKLALSLLLLISPPLSAAAPGAAHLQYFGFWDEGPMDPSYTNIVFGPGGTDFQKAVDTGLSIVVGFPQPYNNTDYLATYLDPTQRLTSPEWQYFKTTFIPVINQITAIRLMDEPHALTWDIAKSDVETAIANLKNAQVSSTYPYADVQSGGIFPFRNIPIYVNFLPPGDPYYSQVGVAPMGPLPTNADWVSFDCYGSWDNCDGYGAPFDTVFQEFEAMKQPSQKVWLIPQSFRNLDYPQYGWDISEQDIQDNADRSLQLALAHPDVIGLVPFLWSSVNGGLQGLSAATQQKFADIGRTIIGNGSQFISQSILPASPVLPGQSMNVSITMKNTGGTTWTQAGQYRLGTQLSPTAADSFEGQVARTNVPATTPPGSTATFNFTLTAPATPGTYVLGRQMVEELVEWFGAYTPPVTITVNAPAAPTANAQSVVTEFNNPAAITLTGSDPNNLTLTYTVVSNPANGSLSGLGANQTYTPASGYTGSDSFSFKVNNGFNDSPPSTVSINVNSSNAPTAQDQTVNVSFNQAKNIILQASDPNHLQLTYSLVAHPIHGVISGTPPNFAIYTPNSDYVGADSFTFKVNNGALDSNVATVSIDVSAIPDPPDPDLSGINGRTFTVHDTLSLNYSGNATGFNWEFDFMGSGQGNSSMQNTAHAASGSIATSAPHFDLGSLSLLPGVYTVRVQAVNGSQTSGWSSATITLAGINTRANLVNVRVHPNPFRSARGDQSIQFDQMSADSTVKIFTVSGRWVKTLSAPSGSVSWDLQNDSGERVASGMYVYLATDDQGNKTRGTFSVIK